MQAKKFMDKGKLVPNEIVVTMVKERLNGPDSQEKGCLLDGYPRSSFQATTLKEFGFQPDLRIHLEVLKEILVERVVGRRLNLITVKIYHLKYSPLETEEIESKLTQRFDDTEEKVKLHLQTHHQNVKAVFSMYKDITVKVYSTSVVMLLTAVVSVFLFGFPLSLAFFLDFIVVSGAIYLHSTNKARR